MKAKPTMFDKFKNLASMMGQAGELRQRMEQMQAELAAKTVEADAGAGAVRVVMNGKFEVMAVRMDPIMIATLSAGDAEADRQMVEELVAAAFNAALARAQDMIKSEMSQLTGGMDLSGLDEMLGGGALPPQ